MFIQSFKAVDTASRYI